MTPLELFVILVGVAFIGGMRASRETGGLWGLASGVEYVTLGFILGPSFLAIVTKSAVSGFEPLLLMALGWMLSVRGAHYGTVRGKTLRLSAIFFSLVGTVAVGALVYIAVLFVGRKYGVLEVNLLALGLVAVTAEATLPLPSTALATPPAADKRDAIRARWTTSTELPALLVLALMVKGPENLPFTLPPPLTGLILSVALGVTLGAVVAGLLGAHFEEGELWPILLGSVLLVVGASLRMDLPAVTPAFLVGLTIATFSQHRRKIRELVAGTEPQLRLPCLLLAGALLDWPQTLTEWLMIGVALGVRWGGRMLLGVVAGAMSGLPQGSGVWLGRQMLRASSFSIAVGLVVFLGHSDELGRIVLMTAILSAVVGELLAPRARSQADSPAPDSVTPAQEAA